MTSTRLPPSTITLLFQKERGEKNNPVKKKGYKS